MTRLDPRIAVRLDRFLDELVTGAPSAAGDRLDPRLSATATILHALATGRRSILPPARTAASPSTTGKAMATRPRGRTPLLRRNHLDAFLRSRPMTVLATMVLVAAVVASGVVALTRSPDRQQTGSTTDFQLLVFDRDNETFRAIDPETLADLPLASPIPAVAVASPVPGSPGTHNTYWRFSADGSTVARLEETTGATGIAEVSILDFRTGAEHSRI